MGEQVSGEIGGEPVAAHNAVRVDDEVNPSPPSSCITIAEQGSKERDVTCLLQLA